MKTEIIYEDSDVLVVYKPAGFATQTAKTGQADVASELKNHMRQSYLGIIHRLDQPVEGLLVFAKNQKAAAGMTEQLRHQGDGGTLNKFYYAVLCGRPAAEEERLVDRLCRGEGNKTVVADKEGSKTAALSYRVLQTIDSPAELTLAEVRLETGRFHQIRAQMAHRGLPIAGDLKYGSGESKRLSAQLGVGNVALCACRLEFEHPVSHRRMQFQIKPRGTVFSFFAPEMIISKHSLS